MTDYCYDCNNFGDEEFTCDLEKDHEGDHRYECIHETLNLVATWPNKRTIDADEK